MNKTQAQTHQKFEREFSVRESHVPEPAKAFIDSLHTGSRISWFVEQRQNEKSFEAKFEWKCARFSIEFDTIGLLEDVEIGIKTKHIDRNGWINIQTKLRGDFGKFKVSKAQIQYSGKSEDVLFFLRENKSATSITKRYEIEVIGTLNRRKKLFEYLFTDAGEFIERSEVVLRNTDNLEY